MENLNYGIIGNCQSAALISEKGAIEWCCLPAFNSSSVFAKILDKKRGGTFEFIVEDGYRTEQKYIPKTNILVTRFRKEGSVFEVIDFMPRYETKSKEKYSPPDILRYIKYISGGPKARVFYKPALEYGKYDTKTHINNKYIKSYTGQGTYDSVYLYTSYNKDEIVNGEEISISNDGFFLFSYNQKILKQSTERSYLKLQRTKVYWMNWSERTKQFTEYNEEINRSALILKLLSYDKTGAVLAAITTSLPETIGGVRNWDYRFCWIRDASMVIKIMTRLGHYKVAKRYLRFLSNILPEKDEKIQVMYGIDGGKKLTERTMDHFEGFMQSKPVRVGNDAYRQKQNDIYGILMDVIYQQFKIFDVSLENSEELWTIIRGIMRTVEKNWKKPDRGIWEIRLEHRHFTFSKVLCWVAFDRAIKIAGLIGTDEYMPKWIKLRDEIKEDILRNAWNEKRKAFTQYYGSETMDASNLLMESFGFIEPNDPMYVETVKSTEKDLAIDGLMYRYRDEDDFGRPNSSFTICTFWLINSLYKIGEKEKARKYFSKLLTYSNHVGLFSEGIDFRTKQLLGNIPQAYSHLALIETAIIISGGNLTKDEIILSALQ